jgi:hypothetical protein
MADPKPSACGNIGPPMPTTRPPIAGPPPPVNRQFMKKIFGPCKLRWSENSAESPARRRTRK